MVQENRTQKRYKIFFFFIRANPEKDKQWSWASKRKSQITMTICLLLVLGFYIHGHTQVVTSLVDPSFYRKFYQFRKWSNRSHDYKPEVTHIAFLKVHKAGSSTVQNILFRFGSKRALNHVIPAKGGKFSVERGDNFVILDTVKGTKHDILAVHSVFNQEIYSKYLWNDSKYIAIVREPLELMISGAYYHRDHWHVEYLDRVPDNDFILNLIRYPEKYDMNEFSLTKNSMAMDFGFPVGLKRQDTNLIERYLRGLDASFDLVLIMEHFTESLILMRRMFNWQLSSIIYIPLNDHKHPNSAELNISDADKEKFNDRNFLDVAIYEYFYNAFMTRLSKEGEDFYEEVRYFERILNQIQLHCLVAYKSSSAFVVDASEWSERFTVSADDCEEMRTPELTFIERLREQRVKQLYKKMM